MKTRINQLVAVAIFTLILVGGNSFAKGTELSASSLETITEPALEMESWMVDEAIWNKANTAYAFEDATDENLVLESWMIDENIWENVGLNEMSVDFESDLVLEPWMTDSNVWEKGSFIYAEMQIETESDLMLESWMTDENTWNIQ